MPPKRRASGQGSVYQTADKRGWHASLTYYDATGKRRRIHRRARTQALATKALREAQTRLDAGRPLRDAPTKLADFLPRWLESGHVRAVKPRTYDAYQWAAGKLTAELGTETLARLTAEKIDRAYGRMVAAGLKPSSIQVVHAALHLALDQARRWKLVSENVSSDATPPRVGRTERTVYTPAQLAALLSHVEASADPLRALWVVLGTTALRISEALGLRWGDLDLAAGRGQVVVQLAKDRQTLVEPKTARARRPLFLTARTVAALKEHRVRQLESQARCPLRWPDSDLVFRNEAGEPIGAEPARRRWYQAAEAAGLPRVRPHDLRHTVASILLGAGVPAIDVSAMLGHATIVETVDTYGHVLPGNLRRAADRLESLLLSAAPEDVATVRSYQAPESGENRA